MEDAAELSAQAAGIEERLASLAAGESVPARNAPRPPSLLAGGAGRVQAALDDLDRSIDLLAERLEAGALERFALL